MNALAAVVFGGIIGLVAGSALLVCCVLVGCGLRDLRDHIKRGGRILPKPLYPPETKPK